MSVQSDHLSSRGTWQAVLPEAELRGSEIRAVEVVGMPLVVVSHGSGWVAMDRWCPHQGGDMADGRVVAKTLKCPLHGYMFSLESGRGLNCRGYSARLHETRVADGMLQVRLRVAD